MSNSQSVAVSCIELHHIRLPYVHPFETSFRRETHRESILVAVRSGDLIGWGECVAGSGPWYSAETMGTALHVMAGYLVPRLLEAGAVATHDCERLFAPVRGHPMAKAALENAVWDLEAQLAGHSLQAALGGRGDRVAVGVSQGIERSIPELLDRVAAWVDDGYARVKLKIKPGWDVEPVEAVRDRWPDLALQVDANSAYVPDDTASLKKLDHFGLLLIEQPFHHDDIVDHAALQANMQTPICLDESIHSPLHAEWALKIGACRNMNIKVGRVGGLSAALRIHDLCRDAGVPVWCGGMLETNVGRAANLALASLPNFSLPGDISASRRYYHEDVAFPNFELDPDSTVSVPQAPGLGVVVDRARLAAVTLHAETFRTPQ